MTTIRVNIGCGTTPTPGWRNYDNSITVRAARNTLLRLALVFIRQNRGREDYMRIVKDSDIRWANATRRIPEADRSVDVIYTSHMIEHLSRSELSRFLEEAKRVLKPGGILRAAVPDLDIHVRDYSEHRDPDRFVKELCMAVEPPSGIFGKLRHAFVGERHHLWMYNGESLSRALLSAGFADARVMPTGVTTIPDPGSLDLHEREHESTYVEAVQP
jgi:predicted SAM-dependent methyltransferase